MKSIRVFLTNGISSVIDDVGRIDMHGPLILYGEDGNVIAGWAAGKWDRWQVAA